MGITRQEYLYCLNDKSWQKIILIEINIKYAIFDTMHTEIILG